MKRTRAFSDFSQSCGSAKRHKEKSAHVRSSHASPSPSIPALTEEALRSLQQSYTTTARPLAQQEAAGGLVGMAAPPTPRSSASSSHSLGRFTRRDANARRFRTPSPIKRLSPQTYRTRNMHHANVLVDNLGDLPPAVDSELQRILGITSWEDPLISPADGSHCNDAAEQYRSESQRNARECSLEGDWKASLFGLLRTLSEHQAAGELKVHMSDKLWNPTLKPMGSSMDDPRDDDRDTRTPLSAQSALPNFDPTEAANTAASIFDASAPSLPPSASSVAPTTSSEAADPYHISTPKPDITVALAHIGFEGWQQRRLVDHQAATSILSDPHAADMGTRFPFLIVEAKGQSLNGSIVSAQNQAAISGASMLTILRDLKNQADWNASAAADSVPETQEIPALCFSLVTAGPTHELAVHFVYNAAFHMYCFKSCRTTLSTDSRILVRFLHRILQWGCGRFKDGLVAQIYSLPRCTAIL